MIKKHNKAPLFLCKIGYLLQWHFNSNKKICPNRVKTCVVQANNTPAQCCVAHLAWSSANFALAECHHSDGENACSRDAHAALPARCPTGMWPQTSATTACHTICALSAISCPLSEADFYTIGIGCCGNSDRSCADCLPANLLHQGGKPCSL